MNKTYSENLFRFPLINKSSCTHINCSPMNIGNHLLAYLHAEYLKSLLSKTAIIHVNPIPQLGLLSNNLSIEAERFKAETRGGISIYLRSRNRFLWPRLIALIAEIAPTRIQISHPMMSIERLPTLQIARSLVPGLSYFSKQALLYVSKYIHTHLFVNIRAGDILSPIHKNYRPLTTDQIREAALKSQKPLLFFGQTESSPYIDVIQSVFPNSIFIHTNCPYTDFEINRVATNILIPISTFSWISTWLSTASNQIYFPCQGLYSREERPDVCLISRHDSRYIKLTS